MIVEQDDSTIVVPSGVAVDALAGGSLRLAATDAGAVPDVETNQEEAVR